MEIEGLKEQTDAVQFTVFEAALNELGRALNGETIEGVDRLNEWARRETKVMTQFGNDHVVLTVKARHSVGINEKPLNAVASTALRIVRALLKTYIELGHNNGHVVLAKTVVDGLQISINIACVRAQLGEITLDHVPPRPGPNPKGYCSPVKLTNDEILLGHGISHAVLARMSDANKETLANAMLGEEYEADGGDGCFASVPRRAA
jgi:hypothetical protein